MISDFMVFFYPFTFNIAMSLHLEWISYRQHVIRSCFFIQSDNFCLLIEMCRSFMLNIIINMVAFNLPSICFLSAYAFFVHFIFFASPLSDYLTLFMIPISIQYCLNSYTSFFLMVALSFISSYLDGCQIGVFVGGE